MDVETKFIWSFWGIFFSQMENDHFFLDSEINSVEWVAIT